MQNEIKLRQKALLDRSVLTSRGWGKGRWTGLSAYFPLEKRKNVQLNLNFITHMIFFYSLEKRNNLVVSRQASRRNYSPIQKYHIASVK